MNSGDNENDEEGCNIRSRPSAPPPLITEEDEMSSSTAAAGLLPPPPSSSLQRNQQQQQQQQQLPPPLTTSSSSSSSPANNRRTAGGAPPPPPLITDDDEMSSMSSSVVPPPPPPPMMPSSYNNNNNRNYLHRPPPSHDDNDDDDDIEDDNRSMASSITPLPPSLHRHQGQNEIENRPGAYAHAPMVGYTARPSVGAVTDNDEFSVVSDTTNTSYIGGVNDNDSDDNGRNVLDHSNARTTSMASTLSSRTAPTQPSLSSTRLQRNTTGSTTAATAAGRSAITSIIEEEGEHNNDDDDDEEEEYWDGSDGGENEEQVDDGDDDDNVYSAYLVSSGRGRAAAAAPGQDEEQANNRSNDEDKQKEEQKKKIIFIGILVVLLAVVGVIVGVVLSSSGGESDDSINGPTTPSPPTTSPTQTHLVPSTKTELLTVVLQLDNDPLQTTWSVSCNNSLNTYTKPIGSYHINYDANRLIAENIYLNIVLPEDDNDTNNNNNNNTIALIGSNCTLNVKGITTNSGSTSFYEIYTGGDITSKTTTSSNFIQRGSIESNDETIIFNITTNVTGSGDSNSSMTTTTPMPIIPPNDNNDDDSSIIPLSIILGLDSYPIETNWNIECSANTIPLDVQKSVPRTYYQYENEIITEQFYIDTNDLIDNLNQLSSLDNLLLPSTSNSNSSNSVKSITLNDIECTFTIYDTYGDGLSKGIPVLIEEEAGKRQRGFYALYLGYNTSIRENLIYMHTQYVTNNNINNTIQFNLTNLKFQLMLQKEKQLIGGGGGMSSSAVVDTSGTKAASKNQLPITIVIQLDDFPKEVGWMLECDDKRNKNKDTIIYGVYPGTYKGIINDTTTIFDDIPTNVGFYDPTDPRQYVQEVLNVYSDRSSTTCTFTLYDLAGNGLAYLDSSEFTYVLNGYYAIFYGTDIRKATNLLGIENVVLTDESSIHDIPVIKEPQIPPPDELVSISIVIKLDGEPGDIGWTLQCDGIYYGYEFVGTYGSYQNMTKIYNESNTEPDIIEIINVKHNVSCTFIMTDVLEDGICCFYGKGYYKIYYGNYTTIISSNNSNNNDNNNNKDTFLIHEGGQFLDYQDIVTFISTDPSINNNLN